MKDEGKVAKSDRDGALSLSSKSARWLCADGSQRFQQRSVVFAVTSLGLRLASCNRWARSVREPSRRYLILQPFFHMKSWLKKHSTVLASVLLAVCVLWSLWPGLAAMADRWSTDPRYAHGYFVPLFAMALLWMRRSRLEGSKPSENAWGLALLGLGAAFELGGAYIRLNTLEGLALIPYLTGIALLLGGWRILNWSWPAIAFLVFMIPLPWRVENALGPPLQYTATTISTYLLQTLGFMAFAEGNVIQLNDARIGVVEACSGLSMLLTFVALSTGAALVVKRPLLDKLVVVASSIPVALLANIIRITATAILHDTVGGHAADTFYHDLAGWIMIPLALILYWGEIWIISHLLIETKYQAAPLILDVGSLARSARSTASVTKGYTSRRSPEPPL
jgi:exosortase